MKQYFELYQEGIRWDVRPETYGHRDDLEMSGFGVDCIIGYGTDKEGRLVLTRYAAFPSLRIIPNDTFGTFAVDFAADKLPAVFLNGTVREEKAAAFIIDGVLTSLSEVPGAARISRCFFPAAEDRGFYEQVSITNISRDPITCAVRGGGVYAYGRGTKGVYVVEVNHSAEETVLSPEQVFSYALFYTARIANEQLPAANAEAALEARKARVRQLYDEAALETGNPVVDTMYRLAKLRAGESIFRTSGGLLHSPGGRTYYAATWCNDQAEYAGPWFAYTGDAIALEASLNAYEEYLPFMSDTYHRIPSSIIAEGTDIWEGAGDRGDAAMWLYGASLFALTMGSGESIRRLWKGIQWCAEYCHRRTLPEGVIGSDSDELENRFPTDHKANLSTSSLAFGGYRLAAKIADYMNEPALAQTYRVWAENLGLAIEGYFGASLHGLRTYRYSAGFHTLRAWICLPLCMGITDRSEDTLKAMFSPWLWTEDGMLSCEKGEENSSDTVWDRATLFGFKGAFRSGKFGNIWNRFEEYCQKRLLCDRVPYAVEAYPEGDKRHLSGESALFCRIIPEGLLSIQPESMTSFSFIPQLPKELDHLKLTNLVLCGRRINFELADNQYTVTAGNQFFKGKISNNRVIICLDN